MAEVRDKFMTTEVADLLGMPARTIQSWMKSNFLTPSQPATHRGVPAYWDFQDIVAARAFLQLRRAGVSAQSLRKAIGFVREHFGIDNPATFLVATENDVLLSTPEELISVLCQPGQTAWRIILDVEEVARETREDVARIEVLDSPTNRSRKKKSQDGPPIRSTA